MNKREIKRDIARLALHLVNRFGNRGEAMLEASEKGVNGLFNSYRGRYMTLFELLHDEERERAFQAVKRVNLNTMNFHTLEELHKEILREWFRDQLSNVMQDVYRERDGL